MDRKRERERERDVKLHASLLAFVLHVCTLPQALSLSPTTSVRRKQKAAADYICLC